MIVQSHPSGPDAWLVVTGPSSLLALPAAESARVPDLAERLAGVEGFRAALEAVVGNGIANAPSFALLDGDAAVLRVVLRGEAAVTAVVAGAELAFSGAGMATWTERVLEGVGGLQLTVPGSSWTVLLETAAAVDAPVAPATAPASAPAPAPVISGAVAPAAAVPVADAAPAENTLAPRRDVEPIAEQPQTEPAAAPAAPEPDAVQEPAAAQEPEAYDFLFGDTIYRTQAGASIRIPNPDPERPGDHDGRTMLAEELGLAGHVPAVPASPMVASPAVSDAADSALASEATVLAPIPPRSPQTPVQNAQRPLTVALQLERPDGSRESLSRPVVIGRSPVASGPGPEPRLIMISNDPDISRSHLRVAVEGDAVVVTDLGSKNGSSITLPGVAPRKLRASESTVVLPGTLIDLGGGTTFTVRED